MTYTYCCICSDTRIVNCYGIQCCKQCKDCIAARPADIELLDYIDNLYSKGTGYNVHILLYKYWYDTTGIKQKIIKNPQKLSNICSDIIVSDKNLINNMYNTIVHDSEPWIIVLKAWYRKNKVRYRNIYKNPTQRLMNFVKL